MHFREGNRIDESVPPIAIKSKLLRIDAHKPKLFGFYTHKWETGCSPTSLNFSDMFYIKGATTQIQGDNMGFKKRARLYKEMREKEEEEKKKKEEEK